MGGANGSRILVTTRKNCVASVMTNVPAYNLDDLSHKYCLSLFFNCAFNDPQDVEHYPNLVKMGVEIVRKCKGVPLAVVTLGNLLYSITREHEWKFVRDSEIWKLEQKEDDIMPALRISYEQLPSNLKRCFVYCSFFPKDFKYSDFGLVHFWMAHGLLQSKNENEELEDVGLRYFKELCSRSFFQDFDQLIGLVRCKIHDLMHDLALSLTQKECSIVTPATQQIPGSVRHLLFANPDSIPGSLSMIVQGLDGVRTIAPFVDLNFISQSFIQTLYLPRFQFLRYLDLRYSDIDTLSEGIGLPKLVKLPNWLLKSSINTLQLLCLAHCCNLKEMPAYLTCLQELHIVDCELLIEDLSKIPHIPKILINGKELSSS